MSGYSPILAVVTGLVETAVAVLALSGPGRKRILAPVGLLLFLLAGYQFAEVAVCSHPERLFLSRLAFLDITWLPPVGIGVVYLLIAPKKQLWILGPLIYFAAAGVINAWILLDPDCIRKTVCQVVVARYAHARLFEIVFGIFYQSGMMVLVFGAAAGMAGADNPIERKHLADIQSGVLGFMLPALAYRILSREPDGILPSVMCHFAIVLAFFLGAVVFRERRVNWLKKCQTPAC
jgi:hypothetical protein